MVGIGAESVGLEFWWQALIIFYHLYFLFIGNALVNNNYKLILDYGIWQGIFDW